MRKRIVVFLWVGLAGVCLMAADRPNILWITSEDNGVSWIGCYGSVNAKTPAIDQLAKEGFLYRNCFDNAAVCAPTRSTWITGMYAVSNGTQPMRSRNNIPHDQIPYYPDLLKKAGYYTSNPRKTDYNIGGRDDKECWDHKAGDLFGWRERAGEQPFFAVFNILESHESGAHGSVENTKTDPAKMKLFSYHPDLPAIRKNYAKYADRIALMDKQVKRVIDELKKDGLYDDTIIVYNSDHGGVMPRSKRFLYSSGIQCPLVIRIPEKYKDIYPAEKPGMVVDRLVSFVDMPKTWLSLAGAEIPDTFQGTIFLGPDMEPEPRYHFSFRERADERLDNVRGMRDKRYSYLKNYYPFAPAGQYLPYLWRMKAAVAWDDYFRAGKADEITGRFFRPRVSEEFYDNQTDFDNVDNLISESEYQTKIKELKTAMRRKQLELFDSGLLPEAMRKRRADNNKMTLYEMVRNTELYPLGKYLDAADLALLRDPADLNTFMKWMADPDEGMRWWGVVGVHLLDKDGAPAVDVLNKALSDDAHEVRIMAAWALIRLGQKKEALACLEHLLFDGTHARTMLYNVLDWAGEPCFDLVQRYIESGDLDKKDRLNRILIRIIEVNHLCSGPFLATGIKIGEVDQDSAIVWMRLSEKERRVPNGGPMPEILYIDPETGKPEPKGVGRPNKTPVVNYPESVRVDDLEGAVPGAAGRVRLKYRVSGANEWQRLGWAGVDSNKDYTHQFRLEDLHAGEVYEILVEAAPLDNKSVTASVKGTFKTASAKDVPADVNFIVTTGTSYDDIDSDTGYRFYQSALKLDPEFFVHTGDILYYDYYAKNIDLAHWCWDRMYSLPGHIDFYRQISSYFMKDDHDTWMDDANPGLVTQFMGDFTYDQGKKTFLYEVPMGEKTYRTFRWGKDLQIWLVEGRDYRTSNYIEDGPDKTIWGKEQMNWFKTTVQNSDATFKLLISPTPVVGPDRPKKKDNHANDSFSYEGNIIRKFVAEQKNMYIICGDRHWQYISKDPETGVMEFSCGPGSNAHAGGWPKNDRRPEQIYLNVVGGFLEGAVSYKKTGVNLTFRHYNPDGKLLNEHVLSCQ